MIKWLGATTPLFLMTLYIPAALVALSGAGALQLMPAVLGVCFPAGWLLTRTGVLSGIGAGLATLYVSLVVAPHPLGWHGGVWSLLVNFTVTIFVSRFTRPPSPETVTQIHGEVERFVYGPPPAAAAESFMSRRESR